MAAPGVLIITTDQQFLEKLQQILSRAGYYVRAAADARRGLTLAFSDPPSLIVIDNSLPDKTGLELLEDLRSTWELKGTQIIMIADSGDRQLVARAVQLQISDFLLQPVEPSLVAERVLRRLGPARHTGMLHMEE
jgi:DNA-binding response OmpR family regulator